MRCLCQSFETELGCLLDVRLKTEFKSEPKPIFKKSRPVPFAIQDDLARAQNVRTSVLQVDYVDFYLGERLELPRGLTSYSKI